MIRRTTLSSWLVMCLIYPAVTSQAAEGPCESADVRQWFATRVHYFETVDGPAFAQSFAEKLENKGQDAVDWPRTAHEDAVQLLRQPLNDEFAQRVEKLAAKLRRLVWVPMTARASQVIAEHAAENPDDARRQQLIDDLPASRRALAEEHAQKLFEGLDVTEYPGDHLNNAVSVAYDLLRHNPSAAMTFTIDGVRMRFNNSGTPKHQLRCVVLPERDGVRQVSYSLVDGEGIPITSNVMDALAPLEDLGNSVTADSKGGGTYLEANREHIRRFAGLIAGFVRWPPIKATLQVSMQVPTPEWREAVGEISEVVAHFKPPVQ